MTGLVLGSASHARRKILSDAGLNFDVMKPLIDEDEVKQRLRADNLPVSGLALQLAQEKALSLSRNYPGSPNSPGPLVIGADQILLHDNMQYDKPADIAAARQMLRRLRGDTHQLLCAVCVACGDDIYGPVRIAPSLPCGIFLTAFWIAIWHMRETGSVILSVHISLNCLARICFLKFAVIILRYLDCRCCHFCHFFVSIRNMR